MRPVQISLYLVCALLWMPLMANAEPLQIDQCLQHVQPPITLKPVPEGIMEISAERLAISENQIYELEGEVEIATQQNVLKTDSAQFNYLTQDLDAKGNIIYKQKDLSVKGDSISLNLSTEHGEVANTEYRISASNGNGNAEKIQFTPRSVSMNGAAYTTCPPGDKAWQISADKISLNQEKNEGVARNAKLEVFSVPVFYVPYISFPLEGRKSGLLAPTPSYSSTDGFDILVPYYFNIAPNYDMTLSPRYIQKRGAQLGTEFRYLQPTFFGEFGMEYLPFDEQKDDDRYHFHFKQHNYLTTQTWLRTRVNHVSDANYFSDLGTSLNTANQAQLDRHIVLETHSRHWFLRSTFQDYQMLNFQAEPYRRLPQLDWLVQRSFTSISTQMFSQYSLFYRNDNDKIQRLLLNPTISLPLHKSYGFFVPVLGVFAHSYQTESFSETESLVYFHTSAGLYFDRDTKNGTHTLSPQMSYVFMPQHTQNNLPLIDSNFLILSYHDLFYPRRYSGWDRFGDLHRITWAVENSWFKKSGQLRFAFNFAHARILDDQDKHFAGDLSFDAGDNLYAFTVKTRIGRRIQVYGDILHKNNLDNVDHASISSRYQQNVLDQLELRHDFRSNLLQQSSFILTRSLSSQWRVATRWSYSHKFEQIREGLLGLEYNNCCWSVRVVGRRFANDIGEEAKNSIAVQFELKGLTAIGSKLEETFSQEIFGIQ